MDDSMTENFRWVPPDFSCHSCHYFLYLNVFSASSLLSLLALLTAIILHNIEIVNKRNSSKKKQNKRKHKISFVDTPQRNMHHSFSNDTNNNNNNILATNLSFAKKKVYNSKKIEEIKTQNKLIKLIKYTKKSKIPINKRNGQVLSLSIKPVPFVIPMKNKNERIN